MKLVRTVLSSVLLIAGLVAIPGVASAQEVDRRDAPGAHAQVDAQVGRRDGGADRDGRADRDDRGDRDHARWERERGEHERVCRVAYERGASPWQLARMGCGR
jgi:hypothetical protein